MCAAAAISGATLTALQAACGHKPRSKRAGSYRVFCDMTWPSAGKGHGDGATQRRAAAKPHYWFAGLANMRRGGIARHKYSRAWERAELRPGNRRLYDAWLESTYEGDGWVLGIGVGQLLADGTLAVNHLSLTHTLTHHSSSGVTMTETRPHRPEHD